MIKKLSVIVLFLSMNVNASELIGTFPTGNVIIKDTICTINTLVDNYPYDAFSIARSGKVTRGCWRRNLPSKKTITFIEKYDETHYGENMINATEFK